MIYSFFELEDIVSKVAVLSKYERNLVKDNGILDQEITFTLRLVNNVLSDP
jgi:hypothetical protein